jgi:hypothetical protein
MNFEDIKIINTFELKKKMLGNAFNPFIKNDMIKFIPANYINEKLKLRYNKNLGLSLMSFNSEHNEWNTLNFVTHTPLEIECIDYDVFDVNENNFSEDSTKVQYNNDSDIEINDDEESIDLIDSEGLKDYYNEGD